MIMIRSGSSEAAASPDGWDDADAHHFRVLALLGLRPEDAEADDVREDSWRLYLRNAPEGSVAPGQPEPLGDAEAEEVAAWLRDLAAEEIAALREALDALPDPTPSWLRQAEAEALLPSREDALALRYEAQRSREFHRALGDLARLTKSGDDLVDGPEDEAPEADVPSEANPAEVVTEDGVVGGLSGDAGPDPAAEGRAEAAPAPSAGPAGVTTAVGGAVAGPDPAADRS